MSDKVYRVEEVESGYDLGRGRRGHAYTIYNARTGWSLYGPYHRRDALERKLAFLREHGWRDESEQGEPHTCKVCGADLSRESHAPWCENAPDPYAEYESEEW